jgi:hypothetical protein
MPRGRDEANVASSVRISGDDLAKVRRTKRLAIPCPTHLRRRQTRWRMAGQAPPAVRLAPLGPPPCAPGDRVLAVPLPESARPVPCLGNGIKGVGLRHVHQHGISADHATADLVELVGCATAVLTLLALRR